LLNAFNRPFLKRKRRFSFLEMWFVTPSSFPRNKNQDWSVGVMFVIIQNRYGVEVEEEEF
jgi:hypothetical protein